MYSEREQELLDRFVETVDTKRIGEKTTVVCLVLRNGFEVVGTAACVNPDDFDWEEGKYYATKNALNRLKQIAGYLDQEDLL